ncbi:hypothetical protein HZA55_06660 [Candidatus Poribacteria bacterium]|nr:hypothetical protein [Candidatus Poribacteria bacterium]
MILRKSKIGKIYEEIKNSSFGILVEFALTGIILFVHFLLTVIMWRLFS